MASDAERPEDGPWDELEQGFFAAAPPDVAVPPAAPMRFDDLDPVASELPLRGRALAAQRLAAWRASTTAVAAAAWRKLTPAVGAASVTSRRSALRLAAFARIVARTGRAQVPRLLGFFRNSSRETRLLAAGVAALIAVTGASAGVVASRGGGRSMPAVARPAIASSRTIASEIAPAPATMTPAPDQDPVPASTSIATSATTPGPRSRKHAKAPARPPARAKTLSQSSPGPSARPAAGR